MINKFGIFPKLWETEGESRALDTDMAGSDVWQRLARLVYERRSELGLTQEQLAKQLGIGLGTLTRLETGVKVSRRGPSWPRIEEGLGWPKGFIEDFVTGKVAGLPVPADDEGRFTRQSKSEVTDIIRDLVRHITVEVAPGTPISRVLEIEEEMIEFARSRGLQGIGMPEGTSDDVSSGTNL